MNELDKKKNKSVGVFLRNKRLSKGLTQAEVSAVLGYQTAQFISNIERGRSSPPLQVIKKLVKLYGIPESEIVDFLVKEERRMISEFLSQKKCYSQ